MQWMVSMTHLCYKMFYFGPLQLAVFFVLSSLILVSVSPKCYIMMYTFIYQESLLISTSTRPSGVYRLIFCTFCHSMQLEIITQCTTFYIINFLF